MRQALTIAQRYDKAIANLENKAILRINAALIKSHQTFERELRTKYNRLVSNATLIQAQRQLLILQEIGNLLAIIDPTVDYEGIFRNLIDVSTKAGAQMAGDLIAALAPNAPIAAFAGVNIEAIALAATNAYNRLKGYGDDYAAKTSTIISEGIAQGWGIGRIVPLLRQQLGVTKSKAEQLARTETISALSGAAQQRYADSGVEGVQWITVKTACPFCMARNGNVYRLGEVMHPGHFNDRCVLLPWRREWQKAGLTDDAAAKAYREAVIRDSSEPPKNALMPFEKAAGWTKVPVPIWEPK